MKYISPRYWRGKVHELRFRLRRRPVLLAPRDTVMASAETFPTAPFQRFVDAFTVATEPVEDAEGDFSYRLYGQNSVETLTVRNAPPARLFLLRLSNVLCLRNGSLLTEDGLLLGSEACGGFGANMLWNDSWREAAPTSRTLNEPVEVIGTPCLYMDTTHSGAYGHFLVDALPRLWALPHIPEKVLGFFTTADPRHLYVDDFWAALPQRGRKTRIVRAAGTALCRTLYVAMQPHMLGGYVCRQAHRVWGEFGKALAGGKDSGGSRRIYLSRRRFSHRRPLVGEQQVEEIFRKRDFSIIYPEEIAPARQAALIRGADVLAGPYGSAMHNSTLGRADTRVFILSPHLSPSYPLIDRSAGRPFAYFQGATLADAAKGADRFALPWSAGDPQTIAGAVDAFLATT